MKDLREWFSEAWELVPFRWLVIATVALVPANLFLEYFVGSVPREPVVARLEDAISSAWAQVLAGAHGAGPCRTGRLVPQFARTLRQPEGEDPKDATDFDLSSSGNDTVRNGSYRVPVVAECRLDHADGLSRPVVIEEPAGFATVAVRWGRPDAGAPPPESEILGALRRIEETVSALASLPPLPEGQGRVLLDSQACEVDTATIIGPAGNETWSLNRLRARWQLTPPRAFGSSPEGFLEKCHGLIPLPWRQNGASTAGSRRLEAQRVAADIGAATDRMMPVKSKGAAKQVCALEFSATPLGRPARGPGVVVAHLQGVPTAASHIEMVSVPGGLDVDVVNDLLIGGEAGVRGLILETLLALGVFYWAAGTLRWLVGIKEPVASPAQKPAQ